MKQEFVKWCCFMLAFVLFAGCKKLDYEVVSYVNIKLTSSAFDAEQVNISIVSVQANYSDTSWVKREEFRGLAKDFLAIPDISDKKHRKLFIEEKLYDESLNRVILSYKPIKPENTEIQKLEILITPDVAMGDKVSSIIIDQIVADKNGSLQKKMLWRVDQSFQVTTISQKPGEPEIISTLKVTWNETDEK